MNKQNISAKTTPRQERGARGFASEVIIQVLVFNDSPLCPVERLLRSSSYLHNYKAIDWSRCGHSQRAVHGIFK